jgi:hypothetical protein
LEKNQVTLKKKLFLLVFALFIAGILVSAMPTTLFVHANGTVWLQPAQGKPGSTVSVNGGGFSGIVYILFNGTGVATTQPDSYSNIQVAVTVPWVSPGGYNITASDNNGDSGTATFTVTGSSASPAPTTTSTSSASVAPTVAPTYSGTTSTPYYTYQPTYSQPPQNNGFWSPLVIGVVAVIAAAALISITFMFRARSGGKRDTLLQKEEPLPYRPQPPPTPPAAPAPFTSASSSKPYLTAAERYGRPTTYQPATYGQQTARSTVSSRPTTPSTTPSYSQQPISGGKICPHCKRTVRADYNICPYCYKKMK